MLRWYAIDPTTVPMWAYMGGNGALPPMPSLVWMTQHKRACHLDLVMMCFLQGSS